MISTVPHMALYRRWRAQTFAEMVGQEAVVETLRNAVRTERVAHALLFVGPRGTGKTSLARILAKAVNCLDLRDGDACDACTSCVSIREGTTLDVIEIDAASNRGIEEVRSLRERLPYPPGQLRRKVYILDEAHQITPPAWNALLKSLEEPPDFVIFMFASTEPSKFPPAILSRLQRFDVRRLTVAEIEGKLDRILAADSRVAERAAVHLIARLAAGGMRDAESMLDQLLSAAPERIDESQVRDLLGLADAEVVEAFVDHLIHGEGAAGVALLDAQEERGRDIRALLDQAVDTIRAGLVAGLSDPRGARHDSASLAVAGRRLATIDPNRAGIGGLRFQLELAIFAAEAARPAATIAQPTAAPAAPAPSAPPAQPAPSPPTTTSAAVSAPSRRSSVDPVAPAPVVQAEAADTPRQTDPASDPAAMEATSRPAVPGPSPDVARLQGGWSEIIGSVSPATRAVINECRLMGVDGNIVTLGFPETKGFLKDVAERKRPELETAFGRFLGRAVNVRSVATNLELPPIVGDDLVAEARRIFADDIIDFDEVS